MARSIGKIRIRKLKELVWKTAERYKPYLGINTFQCHEEIKTLVPEDWYDTWESAWSEIDRIIGDELNAIKYGKNN